MSNLFLGDEFNEQVYVPWRKLERFVDMKHNMRDVQCIDSNEHRLTIEIISRKDYSHLERELCKSAISDLKNFTKANNKNLSIDVIYPYSDVLKTADGKAIAIISVKVKFKPTPPGKISKGNINNPSNGEDWKLAA